MKKHKLVTWPTSVDGSHIEVSTGTDDIIRVAPIGTITGPLSEEFLGRLEAEIIKMRQQHKPILILTDINGIKNHDSAARSAVKNASKLGFDRGAAFGGNVATGMVMQYLQRSIDPERARYFRTREKALEWLQHPEGESLRWQKAKAVRLSIVSSIILAAAISGTYIGWNYTRNQSKTSSQSTLSQLASETNSDIQKRVQLYKLTLYGFKGLYNSSDVVDRDEFRSYYRSLEVGDEFPGVSAISYAQLVKETNKAEYINKVRQDKTIDPSGYPSFKIYPEVKKSEYVVLTYNEPTGNDSIGFDLSSNSGRQAAMIAARDSGEPTATSTVDLVGEHAGKGFLIAMPIYSVASPASTTERQEKITGYVNAVFNYQLLFSDAFSAFKHPNTVVTVFDGQGKQIYKKGDLSAHDQYQTQHTQLNIGGQNFSLDLTAANGYGLTWSTRHLPTIVLAAGLSGSGLLLLALLSLLRSRDQAISLANTMTEDLERERNSAISNQIKLEEAEKALKHEKAGVERKVIERTKELNEAHAQLAASIRGLPFGFAVVDQKLQILFSNKALTRLLGRNIPDKSSETRAALVQIASAFHQDLDILAEIAHAQDSLKPVEKNIVHGSRYLRFLFIPVTESDQTAAPDTSLKAIGSVMIVQDTTEERALQRSRDEFFSIASHELRTPLTTIRGNTSLILSQYQNVLADPELKQMITDTHDSSLRLIAIVNDFLDMSRLEQGKVTVHAEPVNLVALLNKIASEFTQPANEKHIYIKVDTDLPSLWLTTDPGHVRQIVVNLVANAIRFTDNGGVTMELTSKDDKTLITVVDTGSGIPTKAQHLLFRKFQQATDNILTRDSTQSTGLGLYISHLIAQVLGGGLYLDHSEAEKGATFVLELPNHPIKSTTISMARQ